jgi:hypothetical protein
MATWASTSRKNGNVTFTACTRENRPITLRLAGSTILFEPSVYGGDGTELRRSICFKASDSITQQLLEFEVGLTNSCVKDEVVKAKISMDKVRVWDQCNHRIEAPEQWRGHECNVVFHLRGKWETKSQSGLCLEVTDIQLLARVEPPSPFAPC